jgi:hypothetical protein
MLSIYYILSILFIWMNIYYIFNINKLDIRFFDRDISTITKIQYFWYITKIFYWIWLIIGLFTPAYFFIMLNILLGLLKFPIFHLNTTFYKVWCLSVPLISSVILYVILGFNF